MSQQKMVEIDENAVKPCEAIAFVMLGFVHIATLVHLDHERVASVVEWRDCVRVWNVDADCVTHRLEQVGNSPYRLIVRTGRVLVESEADVRVVTDSTRIGMAVDDHWPVAVT